MAIHEFETHGERSISEGETLLGAIEKVIEEVEKAHGSFKIDTMEFEIVSSIDGNAAIQYRITGTVVVD